MKIRKKYNNVLKEQKGHEIGIERTYTTEKTVRKQLIINDKVIDFLDKQINNKKATSGYNVGALRKFFILIGNKYTKIDKNIIRQLLNGHIKDDIIVELDIDSENENKDIPFITKKYQRYENDYDYDEWPEEIVRYSLYDFFFNRPEAFFKEKKPFFITHEDEFDWQEETVDDSKEKLQAEYLYFN